MSLIVDSIFQNMGFYDESINIDPKRLLKQPLFVSTCVAPDLHFRIANTIEDFIATHNLDEWRLKIMGIVNIYTDEVEEALPGFEISKDWQRAFKEGSDEHKWLIVQDLKRAKELEQPELDRRINTFICEALTFLALKPRLQNMAFDTGVLIDEIFPGLRETLYHYAQTSNLGSIDMPPLNPELEKKITENKKVHGAFKELRRQAINDKINEIINTELVRPLTNAFKSIIKAYRASTPSGSEYTLVHTTYQNGRIEFKTYGDLRIAKYNLANDIEEWV